MFTRSRVPGRALAAAVSAGALLLLSACGSGAKGSSQPASQPPASEAASPTAQAGAGTPVAVTLGETDTSHMFMKLDTTKVAAGPVTFTVTNSGVKTHEFVVLKTDTPAADFPIVSFEGKADRIDEDASGVENVGETGDMQPGTIKTLTIDLKPGHYALVCNLPGHYRMHMFADFLVS